MFQCIRRRRNQIGKKTVEFKTLTSQTLNLREYNLNQRQVQKIWKNYITQLYNRTIRPEIQEVETEKEVCADKKCCCILHSEAEKAIREMSDKKAANTDDVRGDVLKLFENGLRLIAQLINNIYK